MQANQEHNARIDRHGQISSQLSEGGLVLTEEGVVGRPSRRSGRSSQLINPLSARRGEFLRLPMVRSLDP
jgi:hypothetical protein